MQKKTYIYRGFERFWHWSQALVILFLAFTGFEIHGTFSLLGYENVVRAHNAAAWSFLVLIIFSIFWHFATGEWKQYIPTLDYIKAQFEYYISGIFKGAEHPTHKTAYNKFNPIQRLIYLGLKMIVIPVQVVTGFFYLYYMYPDSNLNEWGLEVFAIIHTLGAFALLAFVIAHVYLTTTGDTIFSSIQAMITGWEVVHIDEEEAREKHLMNAVNDSVAGYYRIDLYGTITDVNDAWLEIYGYNSRDDVVGKHYSFARDEKNRAELESVVERVMGGAKITSLPVTRKGADGKPGRHLLSANPVIEDGKIGGMEGFILDITETEDEMEHMYYAVRNSGAGYYRLDSDLRLVDVNDAWLKLYKYERKEDVLGRHFSITRESSDLDNSKTIFDKVLKGETISGKLVTRRCSDDSTGKHLLSASPFHVGNNIKGVEGFILDITHLYKD